MNALQSFIQSKGFGGFLRDADMPELIALDRLCPVLVRCGGCRFTCAAQDVEHLLKCIEAGGDYCRDVSFPVGSDERAAQWQPECPVTPVAMFPASFVKPRPHTPHGDAIRRLEVQFNEADCGGVWDGSQVTSDADPGL